MRRLTTPYVMRESLRPLVDWRLWPRYHAVNERRDPSLESFYGNLNAEIGDVLPRSSP